MNLATLVMVLAQVEPSAPIEEPTSEETAPAPLPPPPPVVVIAPPPGDRPVVNPQPPKPKPPVSLRFDGAYATRKLFSIPVTGADLGFAVMAQPIEHGAFGGSLRAFIGSTEHGLRVWDVRGLAEAEAIALDRLHLGGGLGLFVLGVERAARDETIRSWGPELQAHVRFDVVRADDYSLFVRGAVSGGYDLFDSSMFWGPNIGGGFDFDVAGQRKRER